MAPVPGSPHDLQSIVVGITLVVALCVFYWKTAIRLVVTAVIALSIYGAILLTTGLHHTVK